MAPVSVDGSNSSRPATPSSSRLAATTRSAAKKKGGSNSVESSTTMLTPVKKSKNGLLKHGMSSNAATPSSPSALNPSLPRPPSWQQSLASQLENKSRPSRQQHRKKRSSVDERDPGDSVNSTEDEMSSDNDEGLTLLCTPSTSSNRSKSIINSNNAVNNDGKQNICVCVRIRPSAPGAPEQEAPIWDLEEEQGRITLSDNHPILEKRKGKLTEDAYDYQFDHLLVPPHSTSSMYDERIRPVVLAALEGYNGTIFSYGQTGSGKTHTMTGTDEEPGVLPLAISDIFNQISADTERDYLLRVSYLEIYNETLKDLLCPIKEPKVELRLHEDKQRRIIVENLKDEVVCSPQDVLRVLTKGEENRSVSCTDWNLRSSRSHCVFSLTIESKASQCALQADTSIMGSTSADLEATANASTSTSKPPQSKPIIRVSQLNLIDLAGSERATSNEDRRKEGAFINKSLLTLGNVIGALADPKTASKHIPYRDSKLTRFLQTSLSGNARIAIVCTISPEARHGVESVSTLKFAQRAAKIVTRAQRGVALNGGVALIARYEEQLQELRQQLKQKNQQQNGLQKLDPEELESERRARRKAETEAEDRRMAIIQLNEQIEHLRSQILTGSSTSDGVLPRTPSISTRHYGDIGSGKRPSIQRGGNRRLSELAFGIGTPMHHQHGGLVPSSSMRSISSALDTIHSPPMVDERAQELEEELANLKAEIANAQGKTSTQTSKLEERVTAMQKKLDEANSALNQALQEAENYKADVQQEKEATRLSQMDLESAKSREQALQESQKAEIQKLCSDVERLSAAVTREEARSRNLENERDLLQKEAAQRQKLIFQLETQNTASSLDSSSREQDLQQQIISMKQELQQAQEEAVRQQNLILQLETQSATSSLDSSSREQALQQRLTAMKQELQQAQTAVLDADALKKELSQVQSQLQLRTRDIAKANQDVQNANVVIQELRKDTADQLAEAKAAESRHAGQIALLRSKQETEIQDMRTKHEVEMRQRERELLQTEACLLQEQQEAAVREQTLAALRDELEKKEQARVRLAQLKAANTPPDFGALQAKMQAMSGRSGSKSSKGDDESEKALAGLKTELEGTQSKLRAAQRDNDSKSVQIQQYEHRISELELSIAQFKKLVEQNQKLLQDLEGSDLATELKGMSLRSSTPDMHLQPVASKPSMPLGARSPHRGASSSSAVPSSEFSTPTKKEGSIYSWKQKPEPLPLPPGTPQSRRRRRQTTEHELLQLLAGGHASRSKSILQSPKLERPKLDWGRQDMDNVENSPRRFKKGSGNSVLSQF